MKLSLLLLSLAIAQALGSFAAAAPDDCNSVLDRLGLPKLAASQQANIKSLELTLRTLVLKYGEKLGPFQDPFAMVWTPEQGERLFQRLTVRAKVDRWAASPLYIMNFNLRKTYSRPRQFNERLIQWVIDDTTRTIDSYELERIDLQSNLLAIKYALEYIRRYKEPEAIVDRDGEKEAPPAKPKDPEKPKQPEMPEQDSPPEHPDLPKGYKPHTKDTSKQNGKQKKHRVAEVNFEAPYFIQRYYSVIDRRAPLPFLEANLPSLPTNPPRNQSTGRELTYRTFGKREVDMFLTTKYRPLQPSDARATITALPSGGYRLTLTADLPEIRIPLVEDANNMMLPHIRNEYTAPVGFKTAEWPRKVQVDIIQKFSVEDGKTRPLVVAQAIADHIAKEYLYSVGPRIEMDAIDALNAGAFQCDIAVLVMIGILRDVYQIPSRVGGGFRAKNFKGDGRSYLVVPGEGHSMIQIFHDGKWHDFDPTPIKKDRKEEDKEGEADPYQDNKLENTPDGPPDPSKAEGKSVGDHRAEMQKNTQRRIEEVEKSNPRGAGEKAEKAVEDMDASELATQLELGSLELQPSPERNVLVERAVRILLQSILEPTRRGLDVQNRLNQISNMLKRFSLPRLKSIYQRALSAHATEHPDLKNWIEQLARIMPDQDINKSYHELHRIKEALITYALTLDSSGRIPIPNQLIGLLGEVQRRIEKLSHPEAQNIGLVQDLFKPLPRATRMYLRNKFDLTSVGPNPPTQKVAETLKGGQLNDVRLLSILGPVSDFILNATPRPETIQVKIWERDHRRPRGPDILPLSRFSDIPKVMLGQPGKSLEENIKDETAYILGRRKKINIPARYGKEESERITIVLYDTSGSMSGEPARFQAALISAFTTQALSDVSPSGRQRHKAILVPFDGEPKTPIPVTTINDAIDLVENYQSKLKNTNGGTDIQKALIQAMALIADAEKRNGEPLAAANIVLMTDGQADVNFAEVIKARNAIDRRTPLQTMFVAINQTNEGLMRYAMDSRQMGAQRGFYREFTAEHIKSILGQADTLDLSKKSFYTEVAPERLPPEVFGLMHQGMQLAAQFYDQIYYGTQISSAKHHLEEFEKVKWRDIKQIDRPLEKWLIKVRQLVRHPIFKDRLILERVIDDLMRNIERLTGASKNSMGDYEQEQLRHLIRYAAGLEDAQ